MRILILRFSSLGDILLATPVLTALKKRWQNCTIEWVVKDKFKQALSTSLISKIHTFGDNQSFKQLVSELKKNDYDLVFDLHRNFKSWQIRRNFKNVFCYEKRELKRQLLVWFKIKYPVMPIPIMYFQALIKAKIATPVKWDLLFEVNSDLEQQIMNDYLQKEQNFLALTPGASYFTKRWSLSHFEQLARMLVDDYKLVLLGNGKSDEIICSKISAVDNRIINLAGKLNFQQSAAIVKNSRLIISNDSGLLHLAECFKTPVVGIFGSTTEELGFFPYATDYTIIENKSVKCRPCSHFGRKKCPRRDFVCMNSLTPEMVYPEVIKMLEKAK